MPNRLDRINVVDLECACWIDEPRPEGERGDIIEIGICQIDLASRSVAQPRSILVSPANATVSASCEGLTSISQAMVDDEGVPLADALRVLRKEYLSDKRSWISWGDFDRVQFERDCAFYKLKYPFGRTHLNLKHLFGVRRGLEEEVGVGQALEIMGREFEGTPHRGLDDALMIAAIALETLF